MAAGGREREEEWERHFGFGEVVVDLESVGSVYPRDHSLHPLLTISRLIVSCGCKCANSSVVASHFRRTRQA